MEPDRLPEQGRSIGEITPTTLQLKRGRERFAWRSATLVMTLMVAGGAAAYFGLEPLRDTLPTEPSIFTHDLALEKVFTGPLGVVLGALTGVVLTQKVNPFKWELRSLGID